MSLWTPANLPAELAPAYWVDSSKSSLILLTGGIVRVAASPAIGNSPFFQNDAAYRPSYVIANLNGKNVISASTSLKKLVSQDNNFSNAASALTVFSVHNHAGGVGTTRTIFAAAISSSGLYRFGLAATAAGIEVGGRRLDGNSYQAISVSATGWTIGYALADYANAKLFAGVNGVISERSGGFQTAGVTAASDSSAISILGVSSTDYFLGSLGELIAIRGALIDDDRKRVEGYLAHKWGLLGNLASNHPYKSIAPSVGASGTKFTLEGIARLNGDPVAADVFVYESVTGEFRAKVKSSAVNGYYKIEDISDEIMATGEQYFLLCNYGEGVRPLAHGPVTPVATEI